jgi:hypothetical protein
MKQYRILQHTSSSPAYITIWHTFSARKPRLADIVSHPPRDLGGCQGAAEGAVKPGELLGQGEPDALKAAFGLDRPYHPYSGGEE